MDEGTHAFLARQDVRAIRETRRRLYDIWQQWAKSQGLAPVFPVLSPGAIPLIFPAFTKSGDNSLAWFERGHRAGVDIHSWPTLPQEIVGLDGVAMRLWERMVCFPIHQNMDVEVLTERLKVL
jgi:hypothetical protein